MDFQGATLNGIPLEPTALEPVALEQQRTAGSVVVEGVGEVAAGVLTSGNSEAVVGAICDIAVETVGTVAAETICEAVAEGVGTSIGEVVGEVIGNIIGGIFDAL